MKQSGNALFLILIAVALFAALSYAITSSGRGGGNIQKEQSLIQSASMLQHYATAAQAVQRMMMVSNCTAEQISLEHPDLAHPDPWGGVGNPNAPTDGRCHLFDARGGGVAYKRNPTSLDDSTVALIQRLTGRMAVMGLGGNDHVSELTLMTALNITPETTRLCQDYNIGLGLSDTIPVDVFRILDMGVFKGTFGNTGTTTGDLAQRIGDGDASLIGQVAACFQTTGHGNHYVFYYVVSIR